MTKAAVHVVRFLWFVTVSQLSGALCLLPVCMHGKQMQAVNLLVL